MDVVQKHYLDSCESLGVSPIDVLVKNLEGNEE